MKIFEKLHLSKLVCLMCLNLCPYDSLIYYPRQKWIVDAFKKYSKKIAEPGKVQHKKNAITLKVFNIKKLQYEKVQP